MSSRYSKKNKNINCVVIAIVLLSFFFTNTCYAFSLSDYVKDNKSTIRDLINRIEVNSDLPQISAKGSVETQEEAILNPVKLVGDLPQQNLYRNPLIVSEISGEIESLIEIGAITYNEKTGEYSTPTGEKVDFGNLGNSPSGPITRALMSILGIKEDEAEWLMLIYYPTFFLSPGEYVKALAEKTGIEEIGEAAEFIQTAMYLTVSALVFTKLLKAWFPRKKPSAKKVFEKLGLKNLSEDSYVGQQYYGGKVIMSIPCDCGESGEYMVAVLDYMRKVELALGFDTKDSSEILYAYYNVYSPGASVLGSFMGNGESEEDEGEADGEESADSGESSESSKSGEEDTEVMKVCKVIVGEFCVPLTLHGELNAHPGTGTSEY